jgi:hypothetical protein
MLSTEQLHKKLTGPSGGLIDIQQRLTARPAATATKATSTKSARAAIQRQLAAQKRCGHCGSPDVLITAFSLECCKCGHSTRP